MPDNNNNEADEERKRRLRSVLRHHASGRGSEHLHNDDHDEDHDDRHPDHAKVEEHNKASSHDKDHAHEEKSMKEILKAAGMRALGGGIPGAAAMGLQVLTLMWMRTTMNYQYRYGTTTGEALRALYAEGGVRRFYRGVGPGLIQGPMSRFGDTAANAGMLALLASSKTTKDWPSAMKTFCASGAAATWRIFLMPVDTLKTSLQENGASGLSKLGQKMKTGGPRDLYRAELFVPHVGHFPWFATFNFLQENIP